MILARILLLEFGAFLALLISLLSFQLWRRWSGPQASRVVLDAGDWLLFAAGMTTAGRYCIALSGAQTGAMPGLGTVWVVSFGACCAVFVGMKVKRALRARKY